MGKKAVGRTLIESALCGVGAYWVGEVCTRQYNALDFEEKRRWNEARIMHHGELGCLALIAGVLMKSPQLACAGLGLMTSDEQDSNRWFKPNR